MADFQIGVIIATAFQRTDLLLNRSLKSVLNQTQLPDFVVIVDDNKNNNEIYNISSSKPVSLLELIEKLENQLGIKALKNFSPKRSQEMEITFADCTKLKNTIGYKPTSDIDFGLKRFVNWYNQFEKMMFQ